MPVYAFSCPDCGPFEQSRTMGQAGEPSPCPSCAQPARRVYTVPGRQTPGRPLLSAGRSDTARVERARSGEPVISGPPTGRRLPRTAAHQHRH